MTELTHKNLPVYSFVDAATFEQWLAANHTICAGFWLRYFKKNSNQPTIRHDDAVDIAICWGWIDGLINKYDEESYLVRYTPRRPKSIWSKVNVAKVERLLAAGRMQPSGLQHVEKAKQDGRWDRAYDPSSTMTIPEDFLALVQQDPAAYAFLQTLNKANRYSIGFRLQNTKTPAQRAEKMQQILAMLQRGETFG